MRPLSCLRTDSGRLQCAYHGFQESDFFSHHFLKRSRTGISDRTENFSCTRCCQVESASKIMLRMKLWSWQKENIPSIRHSVRTALAATASVIVARLVQMPEAYWAAIATLVVMQSSLGATLTLSIERVVATALGASVGAVEANYFGANLAAFMLAILFIGLLSFGFRLEKTAYRYASVTLTIIVLIPRTNPAWIVALHRFIEVSVGIIVALLVVAIWPERNPVPAKSADE
jgi:uncharacterized membrane protein YccC